MMQGAAMELSLEIFRSGERGDDEKAKSADEDAGFHGFLTFRDGMMLSLGRLGRCVCNPWVSGRRMAGK